MENTIKLAVIGNPIAHSLSPDIHTAFAQALGLSVRYEKILSTHETFEHTIQTLIDQGYTGTNITAPFKEQAFKLADQLSERARHAQAVNTFTFKSGQIVADNTDGVGLLNDICHNKAIQVKQAHVLVLGAGGAAKGIMRNLLLAEPAAVHIANRTAEKGEVILNQHLDIAKHIQLSSSSLDNVPARDFDLVIDTTSSYEAAHTVFHSCKTHWAAYYDLRYYTDIKKSLPFLKETQTFNGLGMLVEQAAESFYLWTGHRPSTESVIATIAGGIHT